MVGRVTLICDHGIGEESPTCCGCQDCIAISRSQSIEELRSLAQGYGSDPRGDRCVSLSGNGPSPHLLMGGMGQRSRRFW